MEGIPPEDPDAVAATPAADPAAAQLLQSLRAEAEELTRYKTLAESIQENAKGEALIRALRLGFAKAVELTPSRRP